MRVVDTACWIEIQPTALGRVLTRRVAANHVGLTSQIRYLN